MSREASPYRERDRSPVRDDREGDMDVRERSASPDNERARDASPKRERSPSRERRRYRSRSTSRDRARSVSRERGRDYDRDRRRRSPSRDRYRRDRSRSPLRRPRSRSRDRPSYDKPTRGRDAPRMGLQVFVAGFNFQANERELERRFDRFGKITEVRIVRDAFGKSRGFGFVMFEQEDDARDCIREMNGRDWDGRRLQVEMCRNPK